MSRVLLPSRSSAGKETGRGRMNYITEIKAFYDRLELNPLPSPAIALWHALMHIANKTGWQQEFTVAVSVLVLKTGMNEKAIERARNTLSQAGLIHWRKRGGNNPAAYQMISLCDKMIEQNVGQDVGQVSDKVSDKMSDKVSVLNKHKLKHKQSLKKKEKENAAAEPVAEPTEEDPLEPAIQEFVKYRKEIKKPMTDRAIVLLRGKLQSLSTDPTTQIAILHQSMINGWSGVFELKQEKVQGQSPNRPQNKFNNFPQREINAENLNDLERRLLSKQRGEA